MAHKSRRRRHRNGASSAPAAVTGWKLWLKRTLVWGLGAALVGALLLGIAVAVTMQGLPSYSQLRQSQHLRQYQAFPE